jgi:uncharacterized membrane protein
MVFVVAVLVVLIVGGLLILALILGAVSLLRERFRQTAKPVSQIEVATINDFSNFVPKEVEQGFERWS